MKKLAFYIPALIGYAIHVFLHLSEDAKNTFQDDMRQHVLGLQPTDDLFGNYFNLTVPLGIKFLNEFITLFCSPLQWARWGQPIFIALLATFFAIRLGSHFFKKDIFPKTFLFVALIQAFLWSGDDLISSTPRAWACLCILAMLEALLANHLLRLAFVVMVTALFYAPLAVLGFGLLVLLGFENLIQKKVRLIKLSLILLLIFGFLLGIAHYQSNRLVSYGPTITQSEAHRLPEYQKGGRAAYFSSNPWVFWFTGTRSGFMTRDVQAAWLFLSLGILYGVITRFFSREKFRQREWVWLITLLASGFFLFFLAHALWFRLFHPNRYIYYSIPIVAGLLIAAVWNRRYSLGCSIISLLVFWINYQFSNQNYHKESDADLVRQTLGQTSNSVIAIFPASQLGGALPLLAKTPIVASIELSLPYHQTFYREAKERLHDSFVAWTTTQKEGIEQFLDKYGVTHILLEHEAWLPKTKLSEPWQTLYHEHLIRSPEPLLKRVLEKKNQKNNEKKRLLSKTELLETIDQLAPER